MVDKIFSLAEPEKQKREYRGQSPKAAYGKLSDNDLEKIREGSTLFISDEFKDQIKRCSSWARKRNYGLYLKSAAWKKKRDAVVKRDGGECVFCGDVAQHVHHLTYDRIYNESLYDLVAVCNECHKAVHYDK